MLALAFPPLDPVAVHFGPIMIRWYAIAYVIGFILGWRWALRLAEKNPTGPSPQLFDDYLTWAVIAVILGGRTGYILFYNFDSFLAQPSEMYKIWHGGMSFHGGMLGVILAAYIFAKHAKIRFFAFTDILACVAPIGLGFGRIANFVNGELYGRPSDVPWAVIFPRGGDVPRHPSQLYESFLEGLVLFLLLNWIQKLPRSSQQPGIVSGWFLILYGFFRFMVEFVRQPDSQLGFLYAGATMGQMLCIPMMIIGVGILTWAMRQPRQTPVT